MTPDLVGTLKENQRSLTPRSAAYATWIRIAIVTVLIGIVFGAVLIDMAHDWWNEPALSQGMLIPPMALYIAWMNRQATLRLPPAMDRRGLLLSTLACLMFLLGRLASEFFLMRFAFVVLLIGVVWTFWGIPRLRTLTFPFLVLATMVPLPVLIYNALAAPLQLLASDIATRISQMLGISVFRDGNIIQLAGLSLGVAEACSGLNSLSALIVGSVLLGYLVCTGWITRSLLFLSAIPLAIVVNIIRVTGTAILADYNQEFAMGFYHSFSGWLVFVGGFGLLYLLARMLHALADPKLNPGTA